MRGNSQALFGKRPTEKDPAKGTSLAVDFTRREAARKRPEFTVREPGPRRTAHPVHENIATTQVYIHADLALKERAIARTAPQDTPPGRYQPPDAVLVFLDGL